MHLRVFILFLIVTKLISAQNCDADAVTILDQSIKETSGLIYFDGKLVTHNDSGDGPKLYEIDTIDGSVLRTVTISNADHVDWEDIAQDDDFIYIGDFGNNNGNRGDLAIYIVAKADFNAQTSVTADTILIQYADQTDFSVQTNNNNYDCEAMIAFGDSLMLFSKNWVNEKTYLYTFPKNPGFYNLTIRDSLDTEGTITGATYNPFGNEILLIGYKTNNLNKYLWKLANFSGYNVLGGTSTKCDLDVPGSLQVEAIAIKENFDYFISSEEVTRFSITLDTYLSSYSTVGSTSIGEKKRFSIQLLPNPVNNYLKYFIKNRKYRQRHKVKVTNTLGEVILERDLDETFEEGNEIDTTHFPSGVYFISVASEGMFSSAPFIKY